MKSPIWSRFTLPEKYSLIILLLYLILGVVYFRFFESPFEFILLNIAVSGFILLMSYLATKVKNPYFGLARHIGIVVALFTIYSQIFDIINIVNPDIIDSSLIEIDKYILGMNIGSIATQFTHPIITEILQIAYFLFFIAMLTQGILLYQRDSKSNFNTFMRNIIFGFYLSYVGYILFPAIGPRFTLLEFTQLSSSLPGLYLTEPIRELINSAANITDTSTAFSTVNKDCMPSGHTMMTVINLWFAYKFRLKIRHVIAVVSFLIIFSTLYLQYHYFIDVIAGLVCAFISLAIEPYIAKLLTTSTK